MRIKKFDDETLKGALAKVKKDFGPEAVILHTKKYKKGGVFGLFGSERTEVTAGIDINIEKPKTPQFMPAAQQPVQSYGRASQAGAQRQAPSPQPSSQINLEMIANYRRVEDISLKNESFARELNEGKISLGGNIRGIKEPSSAGVNLKDGIGRIQKLLLDNGVEENLVFRTLQTINSQLTDAQINNKQYMDNYLMDYLSGMIKVSGPFKTTPGTTKIVSFIGPTGVGKTTTLAKLAAKFALVENKKVVLVSADTYRIAAEAQLKKYGEIMGIPVEIVLTPADFKKVINKHLDKDINFL